MKQRKRRQATPTQKKKSTRILDFLFFCAGADAKLLKQNHHDYNRYIGIGASVVLTAVFASCTFAYAMHFVFSSTVIPVILGLVWGVFIFNLDRLLILGSDRSVVVRVPLVILLALSMSVPFELRIFETEIDRELKLLRAQELKKIEHKITERYEMQIQENSAQKEEYEQKIKDADTSYQSYMSEANAELDGTSGSGKIGMGFIYKAKKNRASEAFQSYDKTSKKYQPLIDSLERENQGLIAARNTEIMEERATFGYNGLIARIRAMETAAREDSLINWILWIIRFLLITVEMAPVLVKLMNKGSYEHITRAMTMEQSYKYKIQQVELKYKIKNETEHLKQRWHFERVAIKNAYQTALAFMKNLNWQFLKNAKVNYPVEDGGNHKKFLSHNIPVLPNGESVFKWSTLVNPVSSSRKRKGARLDDVSDAEILTDAPVKKAAKHKNLKKRGTRTTDPAENHGGQTHASHKAVNPNLTIFQAQGSWYESARVSKKFIYEENHDELGKRAIRRDEVNPDENSWRLKGIGLIVLTGKSISFRSDKGRSRNIQLRHVQEVKPLDETHILITTTNQHTIKIQVSKGIGELLEKLQQSALVEP